jgi:hypothetical protein
MNRLSQIAAAALLIAGLASLSLAQSGQSSYDPAPRQKSSDTRDGFLDFTLKRINSRNTDYGQCLTEGRALLLEETIKNSYFWSNIVALSLLACLFIIIVYQHRVQTRRDWETGEMLWQFEQSVVRSNAQLDEATKRNCQLAETLAALRESAVRLPPQATESVGHAASSTARTRTTSTQAVAPLPPTTESSKPPNGPNATFHAGCGPHHQGQFFGTATRALAGRQQAVASPDSRWRSTAGRGTAKESATQGRIDLRRTEQKKESMHNG